MASVEVRGLGWWPHQRDSRPMGPVDLDVADGELLSIFEPEPDEDAWPQFLRMLAGLDKPAVGSIIIGGRDVTHLPARDRRIPLIGPGLNMSLPYLRKTVYDNLVIALRRSGVPDGEINARILAIAGLLPDHERLHRQARHLSGHMRIRAALSYAYVARPDLVLLHNPLTIWRHVYHDFPRFLLNREWLASVQAQLGVTTIYLTNDHAEAMSVGHRMVVTRERWVEQVGTPQEVFDRPASAYVAQCFGPLAMNIVRLPVTQHGARFGAIDLPLTPHQRDVAGDQVQIGFRPEHCDLVGEAEEGVPMRVEAVQPGLHAYVMGHLNGGIDMHALVVVAVDRSRLPARGEVVRIRPRFDALYVFREPTGEVIEPDA
jgi:multiple sugar transport system ATP-binding protein